MNNTVKIVLVLIIGLIAGYLVGANRALAPTDSSDLGEEAGEMMDEGEDMVDEGEMMGGTSAGALVPGAKNAIAVFDQPPGSKVMVSKVVLENRSWLAVHEDAAGAPGRILGAQRFPAGQWQGEVELARATFGGGKYYAMIHMDDGDNVFDHTKDLPLKNVQGQVVMTTFYAREGVIVPTDVIL